MGIFKLKSENYIKKNLKNWTIVRLSAVMDDERLFNFVLESIKKKKKISLYTNIFFSPILSSDLFKVIYKIIKLKKFSKVIHCSGNKRINKFNFYSELFGKSIFFLRTKAKISNFHPKDLSLSNKDSSLILNYKLERYEDASKFNFVKRFWSSNESKKVNIKKYMNNFLLHLPGDKKYISYCYKANYSIKTFKQMIARRNSSYQFLLVNFLKRFIKVFF